MAAAGGGKSWSILSMLGGCIDRFLTGPVRPPDTVEGADYEPINNAATRELRQDGRLRRLANRSLWLLLLLIGLLTSMLYRTIQFAVEGISEARMNNLASNVESGNVFGGWVINLISGVLLVLPATLLVIWEPAAGGSGLPELISYLNGAKLPHLLTGRTLIAKALGLVFAVSSGLAVGPEGPMVHMGASLAPRILDMLWFVCHRVRALSRALGAFYDDARMRDLVVAGAASGISAAFRAPIGGVMFVLEEAISFFDVGLIFQTYFACVVAYYTLALLINGRHLNSERFASFKVQSDCNIGFDAEDIFFYAFVGLAGGILGSLFNTINIRVRVIRSRYFSGSGLRRLIESLLLITLTSVVVVYLPLAGKCSSAELLVNHVPPVTSEGSFNGHDMVYISNEVCLNSASWRFFFQEHNVQNTTILREDADEFLHDIGLRRAQCGEGQYNQLASLFYNPGHDTISLLFQTGNYDMFDATTLGVFFLLYFILAVLTAGSSVPSGLVIPMVTMGATLGRMVAMGVNSYIKEPTNAPEVDPGSWAIVGAAAFWCGSGGITVAIAVIMLEVTGDFRQLPSVAIAVIFAKMVGEAINRGLYHSLIHLRHIPFLSDMPAEALVNACVSDIMSSPVVCLRMKETAQTVRDVLATTHNGFPVIGEHNGRNILKGLVLRQHLWTILPPGHTASTLEIDIAAVMNETPAFTLPRYQLPEVFRMFRTMGLRHLVLVNEDMEVVGIVTRKDFQKQAHQHFFTRLRERRQRQLADANGTPNGHNHSHQGRRNTLSRDVSLALFRDDDDDPLLEESSLSTMLESAAAAEQGVPAGRVLGRMGGEAGTTSGGFRSSRTLTPSSATTSPNGARESQVRLLSEADDNGDSKL